MCWPTNPCVKNSLLIFTLCVLHHFQPVHWDHHHHHLSRSCHCWQMASTTCAMHFDPGPFSSIDCQRLPRCHLSISFWVFLLVVFHDRIHDFPFQASRDLFISQKVAIVSKSSPSWCYSLTYFLTQFITWCYQSLRSNNDNSLPVPRVKTYTGARAFHCCAPSLWNNLPLSVRSALSVATFKKHLKTHLFDLAFSP